MTDTATEFAFTMLGVEGRMTRIPYSAPGRLGKITYMHQVFKARRQFNEDGTRKTIVVEVRFDDNCKNGHNDFCVTGTIYNPKLGIRADDRIESCGRCDEEIAKHFPELAHLQRWNLASTDGPMHYPANALYHAGDRDHWGLRKGEPHPGEKHQKTVMYVGDSPIPQEIKQSFLRWAMARLDFMAKTPRSNPDHYDFEVVAVEYVKTKATEYNFTPKFTLKGFEAKWHECPFDTEVEAQAWAEVFDREYKARRANRRFIRFETVPTLFGEGKERELNFARSSACWPEATDEQLCLPREELKALLEARLPALIEAMKLDMLAAGFNWEVPNQ